MTVQFPRWLARFNRVGPNKVIGLWAPYLPPFAVVVHRGRKTGTEYRTVVLAFVHGTTVVIGLFYGETDWLRNVMAAGDGTLVRLGRRVDFTRPRVVTAEHSDQLPAGTRWIAHTLGSALVADLF